MNQPEALDSDIRALQQWLRAAWQQLGDPARDCDDADVRQRSLVQLLLMPLIRRRSLQCRERHR